MFPEVKTHDENGKFLPGHHIGRPKKGTTYAELAAATPIEIKQKVLDAQIERAIKDKDTRAAEYLRDTAEGRPAQRVEVTDTSTADALRAEVLAALAAAGAIRLPQVVDAEYTVVDPNNSST